MLDYARIDDGIVREKITLANAADITKRYHPSLVWVETTGITPQPEEGWSYDGITFFPPPPPPLSELKVVKREEFVTEGVMRIAVQVPDWDTIESIKTAAGMWPAISSGATAAMISAKNIYLYVRDTVPVKLAAVTDRAGLDAIDPTATDPFSDGTLWPV